MNNENLKGGIKLLISLIALLLISLVVQCYAQEKVSVSIHQDIKLGFKGDGYYKAGTIDLLMRFKMQGKQQKHGYMVVFPEFEYAEINGIYKRYSANAGYTFNKLIINNLETSVYGSYGWIDRYGKTMFSFGASGELAYIINKRLKISLIGQLTERKDLKWLWDENKIKPSLFLGFDYDF